MSDLEMKLYCNSSTISRGWTGTDFCNWVLVFTIHNSNRDRVFVIILILILSVTDKIEDFYCGFRVVPVRYVLFSVSMYNSPRYETTLKGSTTVIGTYTKTVLSFTKTDFI